MTTPSEHVAERAREKMTEITRGSKNVLADLGIEDAEELSTKNRLRTKAIDCARSVLETYEFKMGAILDATRRVVHGSHSGELLQLQRALWALEEANEQEER